MPSIGSHRWSSDAISDVHGPRREPRATFESFPRREPHRQAACRTFRTVTLLFRPTKHDHAQYYGLTGCVHNQTQLVLAAALLLAGPKHSIRLH